MYSKVADSSKKMADSAELATGIGHFKIATFSRLSGISKICEKDGRLFATHPFTYSPFGGTPEPFPRDTIRLLIHREANGLQNVL